MSILPKINSATFQLELPSDGKKISYRSLSFGEQKKLLIAQELSDVNATKETIKDIIKSCVKGNLNVDQLSSIDFEYIYLMIMLNSIGDKSSFKLVYPKCSKGTPCEKVINLNLSDIKIHKNEKHIKKIKLNNDYMLELKYPTVKMMDHLKEIKNNDAVSTIDHMINLMAHCIKTIYSTKNDEEIYVGENINIEEKEKFISSLDKPVIDEISNFFDTMPYIHYQTKIKCIDCGEDIEIEFKGIEDFLA